MRKCQQINNLSYSIKRGNRPVGNRQAEMSIGEVKG